MNKTPLTDRIKRADFEIRLTYSKGNVADNFRVSPFDRLSQTQIKFNQDNKPAIIAELKHLADQYFFDDRHFCRDCEQLCKGYDDMPRRCDKFIERG